MISAAFVDVSKEEGYPHQNRYHLISGRLGRDGAMGIIINMKARIM